MKAPDWETCSEEALWRYVASHLSRRGIPTVLVGGAAAAVYADGAYRSGDLDLVVEGMHDRREIAAAMRSIGFRETKGRYFAHPGCRHLYVEFVQGPLGIGDDVEIRPRTLRAGGAPIRILSPADCVRDRLASYIHFRARECLEQAVLVAASRSVAPRRIRAWCVREGGEEAYREFAELLRRRRKGG